MTNATLDTNMTRNGFEAEICGRCGGTGRYSFNLRYGSVCFGCGGTKLRFTKRGAAAHAKYVEMLKVPLGSLVIGDLMQGDIFSISGDAAATYFAPIIDIVVKDDTLRVTTQRGNNLPHTLIASAGMLVRRGWDADAKAARKNEALAYQATLTMTGKVATRRVKKVALACTAPLCKETPQ